MAFDFEFIITEQELPYPNQLNIQKNIFTGI